jgi:hypothetical protein
MPRAGRAGVPAHLPPTELANTQVAQADPRRLTADGVELAARTPQQLCLKFVLTDNERLMAMVCRKLGTVLQAGRQSGCQHVILLPD